MKNLNQLILNFDYEQNFKDQDFYVSKSNEYTFKLLNSWPKWNKSFVNLIGEKFSGKTHLVNIFLEKFKKNLLALPRTMLGSIKKIFILNIFAAKHSGNDMYPPVEIKIEIFSFFKSIKHLKVKKSALNNAKGSKNILLNLGELMIIGL